MSLEKTIPPPNRDTYKTGDRLEGKKMRYIKTVKSGLVVFFSEIEKVWGIVSRRGRLNIQFRSLPFI